MRRAESDAAAGRVAYAERTPVAAGETVVATVPAAAPPASTSGFHPLAAAGSSSSSSICPSVADAVSGVTRLFNAAAAASPVLPSASAAAAAPAGAASADRRPAMMLACQTPVYALLLTGLSLARVAPRELANVIFYCATANVP